MHSLLCAWNGNKVDYAKPPAADENRKDGPFIAINAPTRMQSNLPLHFMYRFSLRCAKRRCHRSSPVQSTFSSATSTRINTSSQLNRDTAASK